MARIPHSSPARLIAEAANGAGLDFVSLDLGRTPTADQPTADRIRNYRDANDPQLITLLFQYGRYLLIASSRPGTQAANLQGIWNDEVRPPWSSNYTVNINTEMGIIIDSEGLGAEMVRIAERDMHPDNAWTLEIDESGDLRWRNSDETVTTQPARSGTQRGMDVIFNALPKEQH